MSYQFRGRDRRLLKTLKDVVEQIQARDHLAGLAKKTRKLSNRELMFPAGGHPDLSDALQTVAAHATNLMAETRLPA